MNFRFTDWPSGVAVWLPVALSLLLSAATALLTRRRGWSGRMAGRIAGPMGVATGWAALMPGVWRWGLWPRTTVECLFVPALALTVAAGVGRRWVGWAAVGFSAWWMAGSAGGRGEFWRVEFVFLVLVWVLAWVLARVLAQVLAQVPGRVGAGAAQGWVAAGLTAMGGLLVAGAPGVWVVAMGVMVAAGLGSWRMREAIGQGVSGAGLVGVGLVGVGLTGAELGGGRLVLGGFGVMEFACLGAVFSPLLVGGAARRLRPWLGRVAGLGAVVGVAGGLVGVAWILGRAVRVG